MDDIILYGLLNNKIKEMDTGSSSSPTKLSSLAQDPDHRTVSDAEKDVWNNKSDFSGSYNDLSDIPQADYNQNNPNENDFIKNRPFYDNGKIIEDVLVELKEYKFVGLNMNEKTYYCLDIGDKSVYQAIGYYLGDTYLINWDGQEYRCIAKICENGSNLCVIGNESIIHENINDTNEPFCIDISTSGKCKYIYASDSSISNHTLSVKHVVPDTIQIDKRYLPDATLWTKGVSKLLVKEGEKNNSLIVNDLQSNSANGLMAFCEGSNNITNSNFSHIEGRNNEITSLSGLCSHVEGSNNILSSKGTTTHIEGFHNISSSSYQHVQGKYNIEDNQGEYAHIVGNGSSSARSNAHTLDWEGNGWYAGKLSQEGIPTDDKDLATKKYVDDNKSIPDWNNSEENSSGYIKNRPFYDSITVHEINDTLVLAGYNNFFLSNPNDLIIKDETWMALLSKNVSDILVDGLTITFEGENDEKIVYKNAHNTIHISKSEPKAYVLDNSAQDCAVVGTKDITGTWTNGELVKVPNKYIPKAEANELGGIKADDKYPNIDYLPVEIGDDQHLGVYKQIKVFGTISDFRNYVYYDYPSLKYLQLSYIERKIIESDPLVYPVIIFNYIEENGNIIVFSAIDADGKTISFIVNGIGEVTDLCIQHIPSITTYVNISENDEGNFTSDKTFTEIYNLLESGQTCVAMLENRTVVTSLWNIWGYDSENITFMNIWPSDNGGILLGSIIICSDNRIEFDKISFDWDSLPMASTDTLGGIKAKPYDYFIYKNSVGIDDDGFLRAESQIPSILNMQNLYDYVGRSAVVVVGKGTTDIDITYPAIVVFGGQAYGVFDITVIDSDGVFYKGTVRYNNKIELNKVDNDTRPKRTEMTSDDTVIELQPNILYAFPEMAELTLTLAVPADTTIVNEYHCMFFSGATATVLSIPDTIKVPDGFAVESNKVYELSILEGCLSYMSWEAQA